MFFLPLEIKFLHCADLHLDMPFATLGPEKAKFRRQDLRDTFRRITDLAREEGVDFLFICGDLFEHDYVKKSTVSYVNELLGSLYGIETFIVPGNHDPCVEGSYYKTFKWSENVHILGDKESYRIVEEKKVWVWGAGFKGFSQHESLVKGLKASFHDYFNVLLVHGTVDMDIGSNSFNPMTSEELKALGMDYIGLGHFHNPIFRLGGCPAYNPGSPEPLGFDEEGEHGVIVGRLSMDETGLKKLDTKFVPLGKRVYVKLEVDISGSCDDEQAAERIEEAASSWLTANRPPEDRMLSVTLKGRVERDYRVNCPYLESRFEDKFFYIKILDRTAPDYVLDELEKEPGLKGIFVRKMREKINSTSEHEKELLKRALYYGLEALDWDRGTGSLSQFS